MADIKAIETVYKGYRFRSRLEARWAVFFDALGIEWAYEPEGYDLGAAGWYLPDFWLPQLGIHVEIKGAPATNEELDKCSAFRAGVGAIALFEGVPDQSAGYVWAYDMTDSAGGECNCNDALWRIVNGRVCIMVGGTSRDRDFYNGAGMSTPVPGLAQWQSPQFENMHLWRQLGEAIAAARSARFEHGQ